MYGLAFLDSGQPFILIVVGFGPIPQDKKAPTTESRADIYFQQPCLGSVPSSAQIPMGSWSQQSAVSSSCLESNATHQNTSTAGASAPTRHAEPSGEAGRVEAHVAHIRAEEVVGEAFQVVDLTANMDLESLASHYKGRDIERSISGIRGIERAYAATGGHWLGRLEAFHGPLPPRPSGTFSQGIASLFPPAFLRIARPRRRLAGSVGASTGWVKWPMASPWPCSPGRASPAPKGTNETNAFGVSQDPNRYNRAVEGS